MNPWNGTVSTGLLLLAAAIFIFIVALLEYLLVRVSRAYSKIQNGNIIYKIIPQSCTPKKHQSGKQLTSMKSSSSGTWDRSKGLVWVTIAWYWLAEPDTC